jgi:hypothetical protein
VTPADGAFGLAVGDGGDWPTGSLKYSRATSGWMTVKDREARIAGMVALRYDGVLGGSSPLRILEVSLAQSPNITSNQGGREIRSIVARPSAVSPEEAEPPSESKRPRASCMTASWPRSVRSRITKGLSRFLPVGRADEDRGEAAGRARMVTVRDQLGAVGHRDARSSLDGRRVVARRRQPEQALEEAPSVTR